MFTGIIEEIGTILEILPHRIRIRASRVLEDSHVGDSIAVDGVCLTLIERLESEFVADISPETHQRTTLGEKRAGDRVNLERALRLQDRLGGHLVLGHVDGVGHIVERRPEGNSVWFQIRAPQELMRYIAMKGSIAVNGISLTIAGLQGQHFEVAIVPHTLRQTTLQDTRVGDRVNLEVDLLSRYVERLLHFPQGESLRLTEAFLAEHGFLGSS